MAWPWLDRKKTENGEWTGFLEQGVRFEGKLEALGTLRIDSVVKGTVVSQGTLILGENADFEGQVVGNRVLIYGRFSGTIQARGHVEIGSNAIVSGQIETPCLIIEPGSVFEGECQMLSGKESAKPLIVPVRSIVTAAGAAS